MSNLMKGAVSQTKFISQISKQAPSISTTSNSVKEKYSPTVNYESNQKSFLTKFRNYVSPQKKVNPFKPWPKSLNPHTGECGGPTGPEPTRYGDWERKGRCYDF